MDNPIPKNKSGSPKLFIYPITDKIKLDKPFFTERVDLVQTILQRRSSRVFSTLSINQISKVLWISAKVFSCEIAESNYILTHRPSPSAGAIHPIDIIITLPNNSDKQFCYYNPFEHSLNILKTNQESHKLFIDHLNNIVPINNSTIIWFLAHPGRTESKYENASSLIWRDAGALIYCFQWACTALKINSCPIGSLGEPFVSRMFEPSSSIYGVGGLLLG